METKKITGYNLDMYQQLKALEYIINLNPMLREALDRADNLELENYYIGAGCIAQTVWNYLLDYDLEYGIRVYAPFGLNDLFGKIVRPNKAQITEEIYMKKVTAWLEKWPGLIIIPW